MTIAEKVCDITGIIFSVMDTMCPSDFGFTDISDCHRPDEGDAVGRLYGQKECLKCWTREID